MGLWEHKGQNLETWILRSIYIETLYQNLWPVIAEHFGNSPFAFQDDNAPCHASQLTSALKNENELDCLDCPSKSPVNNIFEYG